MAAKQIAAMGVDTPLRGTYQSKHQPLFNYFKQLFAQVTNPPIDAIREEDRYLYNDCICGTDGNLLEETPENCKVLQCQQSDPDQIPT